MHGIGVPGAAGWPDLHCGARDGIKGLKRNSSIAMRLGPLIDTHQHPVPEVYKRALARVGIHGSGENPWPAWSLRSQLDLMDEHHIAAVVNSVASPGA